MKINQSLLLISVLIATLGLFLPTTKAQSVRRFSEIEFGEPIKAKPVEYYKNQLELSNSQPPQELAEDAEIILVSGYQADDDIELGNEVKVNIDRPGKKVLLVLSSYEPIIWQVDASKTTNIKGILVSSYHRSKLITTTTTKAFSVQIPYVYTTENRNFVEVIEKLNQWFDINKVDVFHGKYSLPSEIKISQLDKIEPSLTLKGFPVEKPSQNFEFILYNRNYEPVKWTLKGAKNNDNSNLMSQRKFAVSSKNNKIYELVSNGIQVRDKLTGKQNNFEIPTDFPRLSWGTDIVYDSKRDIVSIVSLGGEGFLYRFDTKKRKWLDVRSLNQIDIDSFTYDEVADRYLAWAHGSLLFISSSGELLFRESMMDKMKNFYRLYDQGNEQPPAVEIVANGDNIALINYSNNSIQSIWYYNHNFKTVQLTYKSD
ncbi:MAG: hypothetical protein ACRC2S_26015 [Waterburya sp.]